MRFRLWRVYQPSWKVSTSDLVDLPFWLRPAVPPFRASISFRCTCVFVAFVRISQEPWARLIQICLIWKFFPTDAVRSMDRAVRVMVSAILVVYLALGLNPTFCVTNRMLQSRFLVLCYWMLPAR